VTDWALEVAENANTYTPLGPNDERIVNDRYVMWMGPGDAPGWNVAQRFRLGEDADVAAVREEIHDHLRERGRTGCTWEVGTHATPGDLVEQLLALGVVDDEPVPLAVGMVLDRPPAAAPPDVEVRRVTTLEEAQEAERIASVAFGSPLRTIEHFEHEPDNQIYLAYIDGKAVARGSASFGEHGVSLFGGSTLPEARGHGAYRALVAARWADAVERGTPALITQASPMSRPILAQLGFREVCEIRILLDVFGR